MSALRGALWLLSLCLIGVFVSYGGCVIADAGPCTTTDDCQRFNPPLLCARGWCVPKYIADKVKAKDAQKDGGIELTPDSSQDGTLTEVPQERPADRSSCENKCKAGEVTSCFDPAEKGCDIATKKCEGVCSLGEKQCVARADGCLDWGKCVGARLPSPESCDGLDNDCNGKTDDDKKCVCVPGTKQDCGSDVGSCKKGTQFCEKTNQWSACSGDTKPSLETCDGVDNDCNGQVDEVLPRPCYKGSKETEGKGVCKAGKESCEGGKWGACQGQVLPSTEKCDGVDNDCDGKADEDCKCSPGDNEPCGDFDKGICKKGIRYCNGKGQWDACVGDVRPKTEACNNLDDDCDGKIDGHTQSCYEGKPASSAGKGVCKSGQQVCTAGKWGACKGQVLPGPKEICKNKIDDNCDGAVDENCHWAVAISPVGASSRISGKTHIGSDGSGNVYLAGSFEGGLKLGTTTLIGVGSPNGFVAKLDKKGAFLWVKHLIGATPATTNKLEIRDLVVDRLGNTFIAGWMEGSFKVGGKNYSIQGSRGSFVAKLNHTGGVVWFKTIGGGDTLNKTCSTHSEALALSSTGSLYVLGHTRGGFIHDAARINAKTYCEFSSELFLLQLDSMGKGLKALAVAHPTGVNGNYAYAKKLGIDSVGNVVMCGEVDGKFVFGSKTIDTKGNIQVFLASLAPSGSFSWAYSWGDSSQDTFCRGLAVAPQGEIYFALDHEGKFTFGGKSLNRSYGGFGGVKFGSKGNALWASPIDPAGNLSSREIALDKAGLPYVIGSFIDSVSFGSKKLTVNDTEAFVVGFSATGGVIPSALRFSATTNGTTEGYDIAFDADGNLLITGEFAGAVKFGASSLGLTGKKTSFYIVKNPK